MSAVTRNRGIPQGRRSHLLKILPRRSGIPPRPGIQTAPHAGLLALALRKIVDPLKRRLRVTARPVRSDLPENTLGAGLTCEPLGPLGGFGRFALCEMIRNPSQCFIPHPPLGKTLRPRRGLERTLCGPQHFPRYNMHVPRVCLALGHHPLDKHGRPLWISIRQPVNDP